MSTTSSNLKEWCNDLLLKKRLYLSFAGIFFLIVSVVILWGRPFHLFDDGYIADDNLLGNLGDFASGTLGSVFALISVILLVHTFLVQHELNERSIKSQECALKSNERLQYNQRFNDIFFEMLHLYQTQVENLVIEEQNQSLRWNGLTYNVTNKTIRGKDFFEYGKHKLQDEFKIRKKFFSNYMGAERDYQRFYIDHESLLSPYFKTLYRIYDMIDDSILEDHIKKNYLKIIRAQLTSDELFFLRYNALSIYGQKFQKYIIKYNLLKHLSIIELLEFKYLKDKLDERSLKGLKVVFDALRHNIKLMTKENLTQYGSRNDQIRRNKYEYQIDRIKSYRISVILLINQHYKNYVSEFSAFNKLTAEEIGKILSDFCKEIFIYSNFRQIYDEKVLTIVSSITESDGITRICCNVETKSKFPLVVSGTLLNTLANSIQSSAKDKLNDLKNQAFLKIKSNN